MGAIPGPASSGQLLLHHGLNGEGEDLIEVIASQVISGADRLERSLLDKEAAVLQRCARLAALRGMLRDQAALTERAALEALLTRARLRGAERAILAAQVVPEDPCRLRAALQARGVARRAAAEAQLRVEVLEEPGALALRRRHDALAALVGRAAAELDLLEEQHRAVSAASAGLGAEAAAAEGSAGGRRDLKLQRLEARWPQLAGRLDSLAASKCRSWAPLRARAPPAPPSIASLLNTEEPCNTLYQICGSIQDVCDLMKD